MNEHSDNDDFSPTKRRSIYSDFRKESEKQALSDETKRINSHGAIKVVRLG